ncbi:hypothetical protein [Okeania sp.]|uniref:hypothetical protein n=1 Tax=Okeania sp. TaxID=3100323 RepID=UPI002B4AC826|nr:hypothetical protein [Okeania sp.]MEB3339307.1 hypothetical protein [Okeania sp.]
MKKLIGSIIIVILLFVSYIVEKRYLTKPASSDSNVSNVKKIDVEDLVDGMEEMEDKCKEKGENVKVGKRTDLIRGKYSLKTYVGCE